MVSKILEFCQEKIMSNQKTFQKTIEEEILEEIAGFIFSKHLILLERKDYYRQAINLRLEFRPFNPNKTSLFQGWTVSDILMSQDANPDLMRTEMLKNAVENMIERSLDDINTVHHLEKSFWKRLKYLFVKKL